MEITTPDLTAARSALKKYFGYDSFRPMQQEIIASVLEKKDTVVLMPTGGGKSICFQIPAIVQSGTALVVSPLISLMKDQVESLRSNGVRASYLNSSLASSTQREVEDALFKGELDLIYVSPERLASGSFASLMRRANLNLVAIDEAHCISSWGHDFRPEYTKMKFIKQQFPDIPLIALTATADKTTRQDIINQLNLQEPNVFVASFDRPNLSLTVMPGQGRMPQMVRFIRDRPNQSGIVYCYSRKNCEQVVAGLKKAGIDADYYHAGRTAAERNQVQEDFIQDRKQIIAATIAFGMGIDKSNVRWIIHYNLPGNIESYYQEIGRAGRDGLDSDTVLFYSFADVISRRDMLQRDESSVTDLKLAKLDRMYKFATAQICRRRMLLGYFGEDMREDCGNCDVCKKPPQYFDGTVIAQKALSAVYRLRQKVGIGMLIDVLRGAKTSTILQRKYNAIKTYGAGKDLSTKEWRSYIEQLIYQGFLEVALHDRNNLVLSLAAKEVLFDKRSVKLVKMDEVEQRRTQAADRAKPKSRKATVQEELFEHLRQLRTVIARERSVPPYVIFNDATLTEIVQKTPVGDAEMLAISGVSERKLQLYGSRFQEALYDFMVENNLDGKLAMKGTSYIVTYQLWRRGMTVGQIATKREMNPTTVYSHLAYLYEKGVDIDLSQYIQPEQIEAVRATLPDLEEPYKLGEIMERSKVLLEYYQIRLALAYISKEGKGK